MQDLLIKNTPDPMHCERNLFENILRTILGEANFSQGKRNMEEMGIKSKLWLKLCKGTVNDFSFHTLCT